MPINILSFKNDSIHMMKYYVAVKNEEVLYVWIENILQDIPLNEKKEVQNIVYGLFPCRRKAVTLEPHCLGSNSDICHLRLCILSKLVKLLVPHLPHL